jgi:hypothetical protein
MGGRGIHVADAVRSGGQGSSAVHQSTAVLTVEASHGSHSPTTVVTSAKWPGVQFAYRSTDTDLATGKLLQTTTILDIRVNPVVDDHLFEML